VVLTAAGVRPNCASRAGKCAQCTPTSSTCGTDVTLMAGGGAVEAPAAAVPGAGPLITESTTTKRWLAQRSQVSTSLPLTALSTRVLAATTTTLGTDPPDGDGVRFSQGVAEVWAAGPP
jgi:hypothetical protein